MIPEERMGRDEAIDRFWDQITQGRADAAGDLDPADAAIFRYLHAADDRPAPTLAFRRQLRENLMHAHAMPISGEPSLLSVSNGRASLPWLRTPQALPPSGRRRALAQLATAALLVLTLVGSFFAFGPGRPGQQSQEPEAPAIIPAISGTPATPERVDTPVAEFLWQLSKAPDQHFIELGRPAIDPEGNLWVPDAAFGQYHILSPDGTFLETWGTPGSGEGEFNLACETIPYGGVAWDATGAFYVLDSGNSRIQKFSPDRAFLTSWGSQGTADDQFICPSHLALDQQGRIFVSDRSQNKIAIFDSDGGWLATWSGLATPSGIAVDGDGNVWVANYVSQSVDKFSPDGERLATWKESASGEPLFVGPGFVTLDAEGRVFVSEHDGNRVQVFAPDGTLLGAWGERGSAPGQFNEPRGIALDGQGGAYVTEWAGSRVQKFQLLPPLVGALTP